MSLFPLNRELPTVFVKVDDDDLVKREMDDAMNIIAASVTNKLNVVIDAENEHQRDLLRLEYENSARFLEDKSKEIQQQLELEFRNQQTALIQQYEDRRKSLENLKEKITDMSEKNTKTFVKSQVTNAVDLLTDTITQRIQSKLRREHQSKLEELNKIGERMMENFETDFSNYTGRRIIIVVTTPLKYDDYKKTPEYASLRRIYNQHLLHEEGKFIPMVELSIEDENKCGLPSVYNQYIAEENRGNIILFLHHDVEIHDNFLYEKLMEAHKQYDIVGLAGARTVNLPLEFNKPTLWHVMSPKSHQCGFVTHQDGEEELFTTNFGRTPNRVSIIDGLFISVDVSACLDTGVMFDSEFLYHHYDLSFCMRANAKNLKIGVWPIFAIHKALGTSGLTKEWETSHNFFVKKYSQNSEQWFDDDKFDNY